MEINDIESNKICIQVKNNLTNIMDLIFDYTTNFYRNDTYVKNLYIYRHFVESYKINIEMLGKLKHFIDVI